MYEYRISSKTKKRKTVHSERFIYFNEYPIVMEFKLTRVLLWTLVKRVVLGERQKRSNQTRRF